MQLNIGIDDTDSTEGGCTTHIAARLVEKLAAVGLRFTDYPNIIRLNPNIPYKTRGNAAVALRLNVPRDAYDAVRETVLDEIERNSQLGKESTDPAVVFLKGKPSSIVRRFSSLALWDVLNANEALKIARASKAEAVVYGSEFGLVGALAAVGQTLTGDHTFELVAYRRRSNWGKPRLVDEDSVIAMSQKTAPQTFNNYDFDNKRVLITPHGPDPVLLGIRGEAPQVVRRAFQMLLIREPVERWVIFRTNHGTDAHLQSKEVFGMRKPNRPTVLTGTVHDKPWRIRGGHVFFTLLNNAREIRCAAFEPTGYLRHVIADLAPGDQVTVFGAVQPLKTSQPVTVNLEKIRIGPLGDTLTKENPACPRCGKHMKSAGRGQGFRCEKCSRTVFNAVKRIVRKERTLRTGLYLPALKAHRHLTKPLCRYGQEKNEAHLHEPLGEWHEP